jgi:hypothetical protein
MTSTVDFLRQLKYILMAIPMFSWSRNLTALLGRLLRLDDETGSEKFKVAVA